MSSLGLCGIRPEQVSCLRESQYLLFPTAQHCDFALVLREHLMRNARLAAFSISQAIDRLKKI